MRTDSNRRALFVFAHQDDEYGVAPWLRREIEAGAVVHCVYLTDGASRTPSGVRDSESVSVLKSLGVPSDHVAFLEGENRITDGSLPLRIEYGYALLKRWVAETRDLPDVVYVPDWEGGHPDHDAAHLVALRFAQEHGISDTWGFSLYNCYRCVKPFFSSLRPLPGGERRTIVHSLSAAWRWSMLCWRYPSQRRTWMGLFPGAFVQRVVIRRESIRRCDFSRVRARPHPGQLLYERLFSMSYDAFVSLTGGFIDSVKK